MTLTCTIDLRVLIAVLFGLAAFGYGYNNWVATVTEKGQDRGYLSFIVALGVAITGIGFTLAVGMWELGLLFLICFIASGTPMILGSIHRYIRARAQEEIDARMEARDTLHD